MNKPTPRILTKPISHRGSYHFFEVFQIYYMCYILLENYESPFRQMHTAQFLQYNQWRNFPEYLLKAQGMEVDS